MNADMRTARAAWNRLARILPLLLAFCLFAAGCQSSQNPPPESQISSAPVSQASPEASPEAESARETFEQLCRRLFEDQLTASFLSLHYSLADPAAYGISDYEISFGDFSLDAMEEDFQAQQEILAALRDIDPQLLTEDQALTWEILTDTLETEQTSQDCLLYYQPLAPSIGVQAQLPVLLAEYVFYDAGDIEEYLTLLADIDRYYRQILDFEKEKARAGLFLTDACADQIIEECEAYTLDPEYNFMTTSFDQRVDAMEELSEEERAACKERNLEIVASDFIPAYELLLEGLEDLKGTCTNELGLCYYSGGKTYYEYLVRSLGSTYPSIDKMKRAIEQQIRSDLSAISYIVQEHPETAEEAAGYQFAYTTPESILRQLEAQAAEEFPEIEDYSYSARYVPEALRQTLGPAFFLVPPIDRYNSCVIYINPDSVSQDQSLFTTLAHEGIPGHLYQNVYFLSQCASDIRKILSFGSYSEGWATYVEHCAYTMDNGLSPALGELLARNASATLGLHALMDINIHYYGWDREQVASYLEQFFDIRGGGVADALFDAMLSSPANYLEYYVGYLEILNMRQQAEETLGDRFEAKEFHRFLLDIGPAPFTVIRPRFQAWLMLYH